MAAVTPRQLEAMRAYVRTGSGKETARDLGVSVICVYRHLADVRDRLHVETSLQAAAVLASRGELEVVRE